MEIGYFSPVYALPQQTLVQRLKAKIKSLCKNRHNCHNSRFMDFFISRFLPFRPFTPPKCPTTSKNIKKFFETKKIRSCSSEIVLLLACCFFLLKLGGGGGVGLG